MAHILQMPKRKMVKPPSTLARIPNGAVQPAEDEPVLETTVLEAIAVRKWLSFALADLHYQLEMVAKDKTVSPRSFKESKQAAMMISSYLIGISEDIDQRLATLGPEPTEDVSA